MPRRSRIKSLTDIYHIVVKGIDRQIIFEEEKDYKKYIEILELYKQKCHYNLFCYCLMSNHIHLVLQVTDTSLETIFRKINTHYAIWFNMKYQRTGHLQDGRFHSEPIEDVSYLFSAIRYVHRNPAKAGLEYAPGVSYPWSSYFDYKERSSRLIDIDMIFSIFRPEELLSNNEAPEDKAFIDIENVKKRTPDDVAKDKIRDVSGCDNATEFLALSLVKRNAYLKELHTSGLSIRQLSRLTGVSIGAIQRVVAGKSG